MFICLGTNGIRSRERSRGVNNHEVMDLPNLDMSYNGQNDCAYRELPCLKICGTWMQSSAQLLPSSQWKSEIRLSKFKYLVLSSRSGAERAMNPMNGPHLLPQTSAIKRSDEQSELRICKSHSFLNTSVNSKREMGFRKFVPPLTHASVGPSLLVTLATPYFPPHL